MWLDQILLVNLFQRHENTQVIEAHYLPSILRWSEFKCVFLPKLKTLSALVLKKEVSYWSLKWATDLHQPVQENCPHLGLQMRMVLHHVDIPGVSLILLQHVVPYHILTGPAGKKTEMDTMVTLHCPLVQHESMISLDIYIKHKINRKCRVNASIWFLHSFTGVYSSFT